MPECLNASGFSEGEARGFAFAKSLGFRLSLGRSFSRPLRLFNWGSESHRGFAGGERSALMRAVAALVMVTSKNSAREDMIRKTFDIVNI